MLYELEQGEGQESIIKQCIRMGRPLPAKIANAPNLYFGLELYWTAFHELDSCRSSGWGPGRIPYMIILDYAHAHGFSGDQTDTLIFHVRAMDKAYLDYNSKQQKAKRGPGKNRKPSGGLGK